MAEIADKMINGELCSQCGVHLAPGDTVYLQTGEKVYMPDNGEPFGVPVLCEFCNDGELTNTNELLDEAPEGKKIYGLLMTVDGKTFLELSANGALSTYDSIERVESQFEGLRKKLPEVLEKLRPLVIEYPKKAIDIKDYLENENSYDAGLKGLLVNITFKGGMTKERIKELVVYDIYHQLPKQS